MYGYNVELEGIGTFSVSLKSRPVMEKNEIRAESIHFKDVKFRSSKELRDMATIRLAAAGRGRETAVGKARHFPSIL